MSTQPDRRSFLKHAALASAALSLGGASAVNAAAEPPSAATGLPQGKIKNLSISRILLGGNLLTHFTHSRDLQYVYNLAKHYNTQEKIYETMALAEANGINTLVIHAAPNINRMLQDYREKRNGKIQWIICSTADILDAAKYGDALKQMVDAGANALYIWGVQADTLAANGQVGIIARAVEQGKKLGVPCGVGGHGLQVVRECEKAQVDTDFYIKTLHHHNYPSAKLNHDSMWCSDPDDVIAVMQAVDKPWIAFKVMAAGAIPPADAFKYVFNNGADFSLAGMFDFEIEEDVKIAKGVLAGITGRRRPWQA